MEWLLGPLRAFAAWVVDWIKNPSANMLEQLENLFPSFGSELSAINDYLAFMDHWIDVDVCLHMTSFFISFWVFLTAYKVIKSWIPTVSGSG